MILLDTNIISELIKQQPNKNVETWLASQLAADIFITSITTAELRYGVAILPPGRRREEIYAAIEAILAEDFSDCILPFDELASVAYAEWAAERRRVGRPIAQFDARIAAIARSRGAALGTRNVADFEGCGIKVINPWDANEPP